MKNTTVAALTIALSTLLAGQAMASNPAPEGKSREQVRAELFEAIRTGDIAAPRGLSDYTTHSGTKMNEVFPELYPAKPAATVEKTRSQVRAEAIEASRKQPVLDMSRIGL